MASSLLALIDDIATILDDVAVMSKVAAKKTAGVLGDDLALNAQQVSGVNPDREIPVVWAVAKGSFVNKAILVPAALLISYIAPWAITPLLMIGGAYLCFEGFEKLAHKFLHSKEDSDKHHDELIKALADPAVDLVALEKEKIKGAVRTDFILSAEIIVISLGTVATAPWLSKIGVLVAISIVMTVGVYGLVAGIVKIDDLGLHLKETSSKLMQNIGNLLLVAAPKLMRLLTVVGTAAMFMVGGSILVHGVHPVAEMVEAAKHGVADVAGVGGVLSVIVPTLLEALVGLIAGAVVLLVVTIATRIFKRKPA
jgi:hypothetical protein